MSPDLWRTSRRPDPGLDEPRREALLALDPGEVRFDEPLSAWTALRIGGPAEALVQPRDAEGWGRLLDWCRQERIPVTTIGHGGGLLVREGGIPGVTVATAGLHRVGDAADPGWDDAASRALAELVAGSPDPMTVLQAGVPLAWLRAGADGGGSGAGPGVGTVAGALRRVAEPLRERVAAVAVVGDRGRVRTIGQERLDVQGGRLQVKRRDGVVAVLWRGAVEAPADPSPGAWSRDHGKIALFRDPEGTTASGVVESLDLQGIRLREVTIDPGNPNEIENKGAGTAAEVEALVRYLKERAARDAGVLLEPCFRVVGKK